MYYNNNCNNETQNFDVLDLLSVIGVMLGYENLIENRQQSVQNNVQKANQLQAKQILEDLHKKFDEQNRILEYHNKILNQLLNLLNKGE